jgi:lycopene cyclase domain-containing protein
MADLSRYRPWDSDRLSRVGRVGDPQTQLVLRCQADHRDPSLQSHSDRGDPLLHRCSIHHRCNILGLEEVDRMGGGSKVIYSDIALDAVLIAVIADLFILRTQMVTRGLFWLSYGLILPFQLLTNWWLTSKSIVMYTPAAIIGRRLAGAPIEDLLFGFSMILLTLAFWGYFSSKFSERNG